MKKNLPVAESGWESWNLALGVIAVGIGLAVWSVIRFRWSVAGSETEIALQATLGVATAMIGGGVVGVVLALVQRRTTAQIAASQTKLAHELQIDLVIQTTKDLSGFDLCGMNLTGMHLADRNFSRAQLADVSLRGVVLDRSTFDEADLTRADLESASLRGCSFAHADLTSANLAGCDIEDANFTDCESDETTIWPQGFDR